MGESISIICRECDQTFTESIEKLKVITKYPERNPGVLYDILSLPSHEYYAASCPNCKTLNYIEKKKS